MALLCTFSTLLITSSLISAPLLREKAEPLAVIRDRLAELKEELRRFDSEFCGEMGNAIEGAIGNMLGG